MDNDQSPYIISVELQHTFAAMNQKTPWLLYIGLVVLGAVGALVAYQFLQRSPSEPDVTQSSTAAPGETVPIAPTESESLLCESENYRAELMADGNQVLINFEEKAGGGMLFNAPTSVSGATADQRTYQFQGETTTTVTVYTSGECEMQVVSGSTGQTRVQETGRLRTGSSIKPLPEQPQQDTRTYDDGYKDGYDDGYQDGQNFRQYNTGNNPDAAFGGGAMSQNAQYNRGYKDGFYAGFKDGYGRDRPSPTVTPTPTATVLPEEPNQDDLSMTCSGSIQDSVNFTAYFTREAGFSRIELRPVTSDRTITSYLSYDGKNDEGYGIWRGAVAQMAEVVLIHLSTEAAQRGDQVSVGYDGRWGRATCR